MDEFVIEKNIEIIKGISIMYKFMLIQILALLMLPDKKNDRKHVHIFIAKGHYQKS